MKTLILCFSIFFFIQCKNVKVEETEPIFVNIESVFDNRFIDEFKRTPESYIMDLYFSYFLYKHDEFIQSNSYIKPYFDSLGIYDKPSQSYLLTFLWHRELHNEKLYSTELTKSLNNGIVNLNNCTNLKKINAVSNFKKLKYGDSLKLQFPVLKEGGVSSATLFECPMVAKDLDSLKNLIIEGELTSKYYKGIPMEFYIQVKINNINKNEILYFLNNIQKGDTIELNLNSYGTSL
ncbi:MAG: hypothetical protein H6569_09425 [Lewinellaceae bacterium]|nr:hypothetical protein [Lewinellaceae bacterium]